MMYRFFLAAALVAAPTLAVAHNELAREPRGIDALVPTSSPSQPDSICTEDYYLHVENDLSLSLLGRPPHKQ